MNPGVAEESAKAVGGFIDALKREPLSLALVAMNLALLLFFYVILNRIADQRKEEIGLLYADKKEVRDLLARCVVPPRAELQNRVEVEVPLPLPRPSEAE